jgi:hypothetical protein
MARARDRAYRRCADRGGAPVADGGGSRAGRGAGVDSAASATPTVGREIGAEPLRMRRLAPRLVRPSLLEVAQCIAGKTRRDADGRNGARCRYAGAQRPADAVAEPRGAHFAAFPPLYRRLARVLSRLSPRSRLRRVLLRRGIISGWAAVNRRDFELRRIMFAPDVETVLAHDQQALGLSGLQGHAATDQALSELAEVWDWEVEPALHPRSRRPRARPWLQSHACTHQRSTARAGVRAAGNAAGRARDAR